MISHREMSKSFVYFCVAVLTLTAVSSRAVDGGKFATHEEWARMMEREIDRARTARSAERRERLVEDLHVHYSKVLQEMDNERMILSQQFLKGLYEATKEKIIPHRYIVFMQDHATDHDLRKVVDILERADSHTNGEYVADHIETFHYIGKGFTATLSESVVNLLLKHPHSYAVENDVAIRRSTYDHDYYHYGDDDDEEVFIQEENSLNEANHGSKSKSKKEKNKKHPDKSENVDLKALIKLLWNLDRLDQRERVLDGRYVPLASGENVDVYILDTGVRYTHEDFNGRVKYPGYDAIDELTKSNKRGADCNGHGTHCAGTIGGHKYGVAKGVTMYSGRVLTCLGSGAVKGILDMMEYILKSREKEGKTNRAVFSMSVGVKKIDAFNKGVENAAKKGVVVVVASGNQRSDSCKYSPGSSSSVISVAATDENDASTQFSNIGKCMHIFAPGSSIVSAGYSCDTCDSVKSGTSMACPHVAGYAAIILSQHPKLSPKEVREKMIKDSTKGVVDLTGMQQDSTIVDETPNRFMYVGD